MLDLRAPPPVEGVGVAVLAEAQRIPEAKWWLHASLVLEGASWQPHLGAGAAEGAVLEDHAHDGNHGQTAIGQLRVQTALAGLGVRNVLRVGDAQVADVLEVARIPASILLK